MRSVTVANISALFLRHFANFLTHPDGIFQHISL